MNKSDICTNEKKKVETPVEQPSFLIREKSRYEHMADRM